MTNCSRRYVTFREGSIQFAWEDIRRVFGPVVDWSTEEGSTSHTDVSQWSTWATANGYDINDVSRFGRWLIWKCRYGTNNYGNLPSREKDHTGKCYAHCPYDSNTSELKTRLMLKLEDSVPLPTRLDHTNHYMIESSRGTVWGFECTYSGCPYQIDVGHPYFYV